MKIIMKNTKEHTKKWSELNTQTHDTHTYTHSNQPVEINGINWINGKHFHNGAFEK